MAFIAAQPVSSHATCFQPNVCVLYLAADAGHELPGLSERMLNCLTIKSLGFVF